MPWGIPVSTVEYIYNKNKLIITSIISIAIVLKSYIIKLDSDS